MPQRNENICPHKDLYMNIYRLFFIITPKQKHNVLPQRTDEQRVHYAEIKMNKPQVHAVDMVNLKNMPSEQGQTQKASHPVIPSQDLL